MAKYQHKMNVTMKFELFMDASKIEEITIKGCISESSAKQQATNTLKAKYNTEMVTFKSVVKVEDGRK